MTNKEKFLEIYRSCITREGADKLLEYIEAKTDFFASISHDMRTPMNAIIGMSALGADESKDEVIRKYFSNIDASAHFLLGLITNKNLNSLKKV